RDRLETNGIIRVVTVDEREVVRRDGELVLAFERPDGFQLGFGKGEQVAELADGADGVLRLPAPVVPETVGDVLPEGMTTWPRGRLFVVVPAGHRRDRPGDQPRTRLRFAHRSCSLRGVGNAHRR